MNIQVSPFANRNCKEIRLHLEDGEVINIPLLDAEMIDMGNGHLFIVGKVLDQGGTSFSEPINNPTVEVQWKR
jgi:hypothetical protein